MTTVSPTRINPNILLGCHPPTLKEHFQELERRGIALFQSDPAASSQSNGPITDKRRQAMLDIFRRIAKASFFGKGHLCKFLYQKHRQNCKPRTISNYCTSLMLFLMFVAALGKTKIEQLSRDDLEAFVEHEQDRGMQPKTLHLRLINIYAFLRYLVDQRLLPASLLLRKIRIKVPDALPRAMDPVDVKRLLAVIDNIRDRAIIVIMLRSGMRIGELLSLKMDDVRLAEKKILLWEGEKNQTGRTVCLSDDACRALGRWLYIRDPEKVNVFYARARNTMGYTTARKMMNTYLSKAGLAGKRYTLHSLRHTFATDLLNAGMRLECLQQLLGHSNLEMTLRYARLTDRTREKEYFKAMAIIEGDMTDGPDPLDCPLPKASEAPELLAAHDQKLS